MMSEEQIESMQARMMQQCAIGRTSGRTIDKKVEIGVLLDNVGSWFSVELHLWVNCLKFEFKHMFQKSIFYCMRCFDPCFSNFCNGWKQKVLSLSGAIVCCMFNLH